MRTLASHFTHTYYISYNCLLYWDLSALADFFFFFFITWSFSGVKKYSLSFEIKKKKLSIIGNIQNKTIDLQILIWTCSFEISHLNHVKENINYIIKCICSRRVKNNSLFEWPRIMPVTDCHLVQWACFD